MPDRPGGIAADTAATSGATPSIVPPCGGRGALTGLAATAAKFVGAGFDEAVGDTTPTIVACAFGTRFGEGGSAMDSGALCVGALCVGALCVGALCVGAAPGGVITTPRSVWAWRAEAVAATFAGAEAARGIFAPQRRQNDASRGSAMAHCGQASEAPGGEAAIGPRRIVQKGGEKRAAAAVAGVDRSRHRGVA